MLRGLTTITYYADDLTAARDWYTRLLGVEPYFTRDFGGGPAYVEYRIGDHQAELGLLDRKFATAGAGAVGSTGPVTYWAVDDVEATHTRLLELGATTHEPPTERGQGFVTASVVDPFGNVLGVMFNQHYMDQLGS